MKNKFLYPTLMVIGLAFGSLSSKAQTTAPLATSAPTTELNSANNNLMASNVEPASVNPENLITKVKNQKANKPMKKQWGERTLAGKVLIITGGVLFALICIAYGTVSVG